jgi:hypothetical protein
MKVLDIYPTHCWTFHGPDENTIARLRAAVEHPNCEQRDALLRRIEDGKVFYFPGDAVKLDFSPRFFDEVQIQFEPDVQKRVQLRQCVRRWLKKNAAARELEDAPSNYEKIQGWFQRLRAKIAPSYATP